MEQSLTGIYIIQDGRFQYVNPRFADIFGFENLENLMQTRTLADLVCEADRKRVMSSVQLRLEGKQDFTRHSFGGLKKNGSRVEVEVHDSQGFYQGQPAVIGTLLDITERKQTEEELRRSRQQLALHVQQTPLAVIDWDLDFKVRNGTRQRNRCSATPGMRQSGNMPNLSFRNPTVIWLIKPGKIFFPSRAANAQPTTMWTRDGSVISCEWYNTPAG